MDIEKRNLIEKLNIHLIFKIFSFIGTGKALIDFFSINKNYHSLYKLISKDESFSLATENIVFVVSTEDIFSKFPMFVSNLEIKESQILLKIPEKLLTNLRKITIHSLNEIELLDTLKRSNNLISCNISGVFSSFKPEYFIEMKEVFSKITDFTLSYTNREINEIFLFLPNLIRLNLSNCIEVTNTTFENLNKLEYLDIENCPKITNDAFKYFTKLKYLNMKLCLQKEITDEAFKYLENLNELKMSSCRQETITDSAFKFLKNLAHLDISGCSQKEISDQAFKNFSNLITLNMICCNQNTITDNAFLNLKNLRKLEMACCDQESITDKAFEYMPNLINLNMDFCYQKTITQNPKNINPNLLYLKSYKCNFL